jgi:hypothetical protein
MAVVKVEGKTYTLPDEIVAAGKEAIRATLSVDVPGVENADIQIVERPGAPSVVTVSKRAQPKGVTLSPEQARIANALINAPDYRNPAVALASEVMSAEAAGDGGALFASLVRRGDIERAVSELNREGQAVSDALLKLVRAPAACSEFVPVGF